MIDALQAVDPDVQIVAMNYYNPNLATWIGFFPGTPGQQAPNPAFAVTSNIVSTVGNDLLEAQFTSRGVLVADVELEFSGEDFDVDDIDGVPNNVEVICKWTSMCPLSAHRRSEHPRQRRRLRPHQRRLRTGNRQLRIGGCGKGWLTCQTPA